MLTHVFGAVFQGNRIIVVLAMCNVYPCFTLTNLGGKIVHYTWQNMVHIQYSGYGALEMELI